MKKYVFGLGSAQVLGNQPPPPPFFFHFHLLNPSFLRAFYLYVCYLPFSMCMMQVLVTAVVVGLVAHFVSGLPGPASIVIGNGLALSSTAVVLQVAEFSLNSSISAFSN
jgi:Kef-type K+ transport system membrane component KefB